MATEVSVVVKLDEAGGRDVAQGYVLSQSELRKLN